MEKKRIVEDSFSKESVPDFAYWGAQTARSLNFFNIGRDRMPPSLIRAYGVLKECAAEANLELGKLEKEKAEAIIQAAQEVGSGNLFEHFPLSVWQTGSGTQTNMNVNEVIASRACEIKGRPLDARDFIHPNDHVNLSQSTNDSFPTAMTIAAAEDLSYRLIPSLEQLLDELKERKEAFDGIVKIGRTHLMDATPLTLGQEFSGYVAQIEQALNSLKKGLEQLYPLAIGGTAVGTGLNASKEFTQKVVKKIAAKVKLPFIEAENKFAALASHEPLLGAHGAIKGAACALFKIATDLAWMVSGPRASLCELTFHPNEPGSSIMPGKFNPTQCEAMKMVCAQIIGNDVALGMGALNGNFELNVFKPLIIYNFHHSCEILSDACLTFSEHFLKSLKPNQERLQEYVERSLMLVTALNPVIGYDKASQIAKKAYNENSTLTQAAVDLGYLTEEECRRYLDPNQMI